MITIREEKRLMRATVKARILAMDAIVRQGQEAAIRRKFIELNGLRQARTILLYASHFPDEFSTWPLMDFVLQNGQRLVCPRVCVEPRRLDLFVVQNPKLDFESGARTLPEPSGHLERVRAREVDWALIPGVAFDARGFRLGRGGGYYDRLIPGLRDDCPRWSLAFDEQWVEAVPVEPQDQRLTGVVSPSLAT